MRGYRYVVWYVTSTGEEFNVLVKTPYKVMDTVKLSEDMRGIFDKNIYVTSFQLVAEWKR